MRRIACFTLSAILAGPVQAQGAIGSVVYQMTVQRNEHLCMSGRSWPTAEEQEALVPTKSAMQSCWTGVRRRRPAAILTAFHPRDDKAVWHYGTQRYWASALAEVVDPVAVRATVLDAEPVSFKRSGDAVTAVGVWQACGPGSEPAGRYNALLFRRGGTWKLAELIALEAADRPAGVTQFCHRPGDVEPYLAAVAEDEARRAEKKAQKAAERAAAAAR